MARKNKNRNADNSYADFIPYEKSSKSEKRRRDRERRKDWGNINPATKIVPNKKKKEKRKRDNYYERDWEDNYENY